MAESTLLPDLGTETLIPICALVGKAFALIQWLLVSKAKLTTDKSHSDNKNGFTEALIEEKDGVSDHSVVHKCVDIQSAISEGTLSFEEMPYLKALVQKPNLKSKKLENIEKNVERKKQQKNVEMKLLVTFFPKQKLASLLMNLESFGQLVYVNSLFLELRRCYYFLWNVD